jgi:MATE family multidrug resistance protein
VRRRVTAKDVQDLEAAGRWRRRLRAVLEPGSLDRSILAIALPSMLTNVATALFGLADMWVIGRLGQPTAQGAVEVGAKLLMTLLVVFNFLRSATVSLTAQAAGRGDEVQQGATLARGLAAALLIGCSLLALRPVIVQAGLMAFGASGGVADAARAYVRIRYWGSLPWLLNAVAVGWLIGRRRVRTVLLVEVCANLAHVCLDIVLVLGLGLGVAGVAFSTLTSETVKTLALGLALSREDPARRLPALVRSASTWRPEALLALFRLNRDLFGRTLLLMSATVLLTRAGALQGAAVLSANAILYQMFMLSALMLDGFESAAQVLCGEALGASDRRAFDRAVSAILAWAGAMAVLIALVMGLVGAPFEASFSTAPTVEATTRRYGFWVVLLPLAGVGSFVFDGVFIGAGWMRGMLLSMGGAMIVFVLALAAASPLGNNGLWLAFALFFVARTLGQAWLRPGLAMKSFPGG